MKGRSLSTGLVLIVSALIISSCGPAAAEPTVVPTAAPTEPPTPVPMSTPTEVALEVPDPTRARDAALAHISEHFPEQAVPEQGWAEEDVTKEGLVGSSSFQYTAGDWVVTVSFPVVAPAATIYQVIAANGATGFQWEGEVDAAGQVTELAVAQGPDVIFEGVSFSYDDAMAGDVVPDVRSATGPAGPDRAEWEVEPEHIRFSFEGYVLPETFHEPRIAVYPVGEFEGASEMAARIVAAVRQTLADRPDVPQPNPIVPPFNAGQLVSAQLAYVEFADGSGFRFLTQMGQAYAPINNQELFYAFQGITDDGQWYVAAVLPVAHPSLPADGTEIPGDDFEAFAQNFDTYAAEIKKQLNAENASNFTPDLSLLDAMMQSLDVTELSAPAAGVPVVAWYGYVASTPEGGQFDDYLVLLPEEARRAVGIEGAEEAVETEIVALRDKEEPGKYAHFWGTLHCDVPEYGGCQVRVTRLRVDGPGPFFDPDPVDGWQGTIVSGPPGPRSGGDDYLVVLVDGIPIEYGIDSRDAEIAAQIESLRDTGAIVRVWGQVSAGVIDWNGTQIQVHRLEIAVEAPSAPVGYEGWKPYANAALGYELWYPGDCQVMGANLNETVQFSGPLVEGEHWPVLTVSHYDSDFYHPPAGTDVGQWIADQVDSYNEIDTEVDIGGLPAVHLRVEAGPGWYASDAYYFLKDGQLYHILLLHTGGREDWELYNAFLQGFGFSSEQASADDTAGWGTYTNEAFGYALRYPAEATVLGPPQGTGIQITGPLVDNDHWPFFEVHYLDSDFFHPPVDADLQQWVLAHVLSYDAVDTETQIAGRPTVHLRHEASQQAGSRDEYYVVKDGQLFRIVIMHSQSGPEDWDLYNAFLQSFTFQ